MFKEPLIARIIWLFKIYCLFKPCMIWPKLNQYHCFLAGLKDPMMLWCLWTRSFTSCQNWTSLSIYRNTCLTSGAGQLRRYWDWELTKQKGDHQYPSPILRHQHRNFGSSSWWRIFTYGIGAFACSEVEL